MDKFTKASLLVLTFVVSVTLLIELRFFFHDNPDIPFGFVLYLFASVSLGWVTGLVTAKIVNY